ncbi:hypothetical protein DIE16_27380 [Burkholderia sp. Bp9090]|nr:hypothetical protein DIE16_27380 [Burkholderia sp. Bp9090]
MVGEAGNLTFHTIQIDTASPTMAMHLIFLMQFSADPRFVCAAIDIGQAPRRRSSEAVYRISISSTQSLDAR